MEIEIKPKYTGINWSGLEVTFTKTWGGHEFTDEECEALLRGDTICIKDCKSKKGSTFGCYGKLEQQEYNGHKFWGFKNIEWYNEPIIPNTWCGHTFTDIEKNDLEAGKIIELTDTVSSRTGKAFTCSIKWDYQDNDTAQKYIVPVYDICF